MRAADTATAQNSQSCQNSRKQSPASGPDVQSALETESRKDLKPEASAEWALPLDRPPLYSC